MIRKFLIGGLLFILCLSVLGCGMSQEEKQKDLDIKLYAIEQLVDFDLMAPYRKYRENYIGQETYMTNEQKFEKRLEAANEQLKYLQAFQRKIEDEKTILKKGNDIDKDDEVGKLRSEFTDLAKELEEMTRFKILILEKAKNGEKKATKEEIDKINNLKNSDRAFADEMEKAHKHFSEIIRKYNVSGLDHI